jgi:hypothetical protein
MTTTTDTTIKQYTEILATIYSKEVELDYEYRHEFPSQMKVQHLENLLREHKRAERAMAPEILNAEELKQAESDKVKEKQKAYANSYYKQWCERVCNAIDNGCAKKHRVGFIDNDLYAKCTTDDKLEMLTTVIHSMLCSKWVDIIDQYLRGSHLCIDGSIVPCKVGEIEGYEEMMEVRGMCLRKEIHTKNRITWASKMATHLIRFVKIETTRETDQYARQISVNYLLTSYKVPNYPVD